MLSALRAQTITGETAVASELLHELFGRQAAASPDALALVCGSKSLTYGELNRRANQLACLLTCHGVGRGDCVGLLLPRSLEVYVALLGILKAGAAYVPLDPDHPSERVAFILADCKARALVTTTVLAEKALGFAGNLICLDARQSELAGLPTQKPPLTPGLTGTDLCYVIYTSGTTGRPKGVAIEHRSVCHLVRTEAQLFQVQPADRVYQGFSIAFDASVEEIWLAFCAGATLFAGTQEMVCAGPELSRLLTEARVTVLSCVPTLLSMIEDDVPAVRLLILGGEACPPNLVKRWSKTGRRVVNTYGPTEATVIATWADCSPDRPITIGRPLPEYSAHILDEKLQPVAYGAAGELCLGGIGLAREYVGRPELTREKFICFSSPDAPPQRLYRTGDLARWTSNGELEFLGRLDAQVKIRGFRVELSEIEAVLMENSEVKAAAVRLREDVAGMQQLVGYVVPKDGKPPDLTRLRQGLRSRLPSYMVPGLLETLSELPLLTSGKVDRERLPAPGETSVATARQITAPRNQLEQSIATAWTKLFAPVTISVNDNFFLDLGGHSLLAARMVSELRPHPPFEQLSMLDVYRHPTIQGLATAIQARTAQSAILGPQPPHSAAQSPGPSQIPTPRDTPRSAIRAPHFFCGLAQLFSLVFVLSFFALQWLAPYLTYTVLVEEEYGSLAAILGAFASLILFYPIMLAIPILTKWLVIGRYRAGSYPLWGSYYFRWWLVTSIEAAVPVAYLEGTPLLNVYLRLMGARVGPNAFLGSSNCVIYDLLTIGEDSHINAEAGLLGYTVEDGLLKIGPISVGKRCFVGTRARLGLDTVMEDDSALEDLSLLSRGLSIPRGETWLGSPAQNVTTGNATSDSSREETDASRPSLPRRFLFGCLHGIGLLIFPVLVVAALFPGIVVMNKLNYIDPYYWYLLVAPLVALSFVVLLCLEIAAVKWVLLGKVQSGRHPLHSFYYLRKWFVDQTLDLSLDVLGPLYASVYLTPWYKLLGARLGYGVEISTASFISPDLLSIGDESFIADSVSLGAPRVRNGCLNLGRNHIGKRSFIGNSALLPPDTCIGDNVLIGCLSTPPASARDAAREDTAWLGSPAIFLPERQKSVAFSATTTFQPSIKLRVQRAVIEFIRVITPSTGFIILLSLLFSALLLLHDRFSLLQTLCFFPLLYLGCGCAAALFTILAKWLLVGRYRAGEQPLWSTFVWRNELLNALHEHLAGPFLIGALTGTPFLCWYFRLLGARIGRGVYLETTDLSEFDLAHIGDEAVLNADCTVQTHLFEDRIMKMSTVEIGPRCKVGAASLVLYDTRMEEGSALGDLSLLMKGEVLPAGSHWEGIPARSLKAKG